MAKPFDIIYCITFLTAISVFIFAILYFHHFFHGMLSWDSSGLITGGVLAGGLHALTGPDHIAAIIPLIVGKQWYTAAVYGGLWGIGHSLSCAFLATCGYLIEDSVQLLPIQLDQGLLNYLVSLAEEYGDVVIGSTFLVIGYIGISESENKHENINGDESEKLPLSNPDNDTTPRFSSLTSRRVLIIQSCTVCASVFLNGLILGLSWDGLPSLAPAFSVDSYHSLSLFIMSYLCGTVVAMSVAASLIGLVTTHIGRFTHASVPYRLSYACSVIAIVVGTVWIGKSAMRRIQLHTWNTFSSRIICILTDAAHIIVVLAPLSLVAAILMTLMGQYRWHDILYDRASIVPRLGLFRGQGPHSSCASESKWQVYSV